MVSAHNGKLYRNENEQTTAGHVDESDMSGDDDKLQRTHRVTTAYTDRRAKQGHTHGSRHTSRYIQLPGGGGKCL